MLQDIKFSQFNDPNSWATPGITAVRFNGNISQWLSDPGNVADLDAVLTGKAITVRHNPKAT